MRSTDTAPSICAQKASLLHRAPGGKAVRRVPDPNHLLNASSISKSFAGVQALKGVSFELREGEVHALIGENGAGKSTLIKIMTGALEPDSGTLEMNGQAIGRHSPAHAQIGRASCRERGESSEVVGVV